uniref:Uncharacterized protein n=1 Tax=Caenorhabditis tropicalis TaxID=1561998 RepID=A0A1I7UJK4_9PELO
MFFLLLFLPSIINSYKIAIPANLIDEVNPVLEFVDFRVQVIPYETKPLWNIKQEYDTLIRNGDFPFLLPEPRGEHQTLTISQKRTVEMNALLSSIR